MKNDEIHPVEIFAGTAWEVALVQSLLANAEIQTFLKDEINGTLVPWVIASGGMGSIKIIVSNLDYDRAKLIVEEYGKI
jgi:hypothetical protein